ncbi:head-tail connector protein [Enterococcus hailinensis]|uniref:head-tail connector protein n=1 Tax=Enterococcus hailinensis TaxID=3238988 RepID=UPI0038B3712E
MILDPKNEVDLDEIKIAIREDYTDDDIGVKRAAMAAIAYVKGAIGNDKPSFYMQKNETIDLINLSVLLLTDHYYHAGSATIESQTQNGALREYDLGFNSILLQLKASYLVFKEGDSSGKD